MKKYLIAPVLRAVYAAVLALTLTPAFPQSLNNIAIGNKYDGPRDVETTVGDYKGTLTIGKLSDGTVYSFHFISRNVLNNRSEIPLFISDADNFLKYVNKDFKITLDRKYWKHREFSEGNIYDVATCSNDSTSYLVSFTINLFENFSSVLFTVTNENLSGKGAEEHLLNKAGKF